MRNLVLVGVVVAASGCSLFPGSRRSTAANTAAAPAPAPKEDPRFSHSAAELDAFIAEHTEGYQEVGEPVEGSLESFEPWELTMKRGKCYRYVIRLEDGAVFGEHARKGVAFKYTSPGHFDVMGGPGVHGPGAVVSGGCPQTDRKATFDMYANWGSATNKARLHELGAGGFTAQLYEKSIGEAELAKQQADTERQLEESRRFNEEYRQKEEQRKKERDARWNDAPSPSNRSNGSSPKGPQTVSVSIKNECKQTVKLFFGDKPKFGSGTYSSLGSNTLTSRSMREGDMIWLVDDSQNGMGAVTVSSATRKVEILPSCTGIVTR